MWVKNRTRIVALLLAASLLGGNRVQAGEPGDWGAALLLAPVFIVGYPIELLARWETREWDKRVAQLKSGMTKREVKKIVGLPRQVEKKGEVWLYGVGGSTSSRISKLKLHFTNDLLDEILPNHYEEF